MTKERKALEEACTRATIEKNMKLDGLEHLFFNGQDYGAGFHDGAISFSWLKPKSLLRQLLAD